jgi:hypothetical protein
LRNDRSEYCGEVPVERATEINVEARSIMTFRLRCG